jgi:methyl-accepting chemotaxis protein
VRNSPRDFSIRSKLLLAFGAVAATTVIATVTGSLLLSQVGGLLDGIATRSIPAVVATFELSSETQALVANAPNLLGAETQDRRAEQRGALRDMQAAVTRRLDVVGSFGAEPAAMQRLRGHTSAMNDKLTALDGAVAARLDMAAQRVAMAEKSDQIQATLVGLTRPVLEKVQADVSMMSMTLSGDQADATSMLLSLVSRQVPFIEAMADLSSDITSLSQLLDRSDSASDVVAVQNSRKEFLTVMADAAEKLDIAEALEPTKGLRNAVEQLFAQGDSERGAFAVRLKELGAQQDGRKLLADTRAVASELAGEVARQAEAVRLAATAATAESHRAIDSGNLVMLVIAGASVLGAAAIVWFYISRNLLARISGLQVTMLRIADGDLAVEVAGTDRADEIGRMAQALQVFRQNAHETQSLRASADKAHVDAARRQAAMDRHTQDFGASAAGVMGNLARSATTMRDAAGEMSEASQRTRTTASQTAEGAAGSASNMAAVAAASEQMSASINEISHQVARATQAARDAVQRASATDAKVSGMAELADRIGDVVRLITDIAGRTNLLALNATIEAARAGDAGKGFAVVAGEVKALATQTGKATEEIAAQVSAIRTATAESVAAVREVGTAISEVEEVATAIAAAVEQQAASTREIAAGVQAVTVSAQDAHRSMQELSTIAEQTDVASAKVLGGADEVRSNADMLRAEVTQFLEAMASADAEERRRYERIVVKGLEATLQTAGRPKARAPVVDISRGGAALRCDWPLDPGVEVDLELPGADGSVTARVVRCDRGVLALAFRQEATMLRRVDQVLTRIGDNRMAIAA